MTPTENLPQFKAQPWVLFDTIAARSFLVGENRPPFFAFNTPGPAITQGGEMVFFATGRTRAVCPWYTNFDTTGQLSVGFEVWQVSFKLGMPVFPDSTLMQLVNGQFIPTSDQELGPPLNLAQLIVNFGILELDLGQEEQMDFPLTRFGAGGGVYLQGGAGNTVGQNAWIQQSNWLALPEPVMMPRLQSIAARVKLAPEVFPVIGFPVLGAEGVGNPIPNYTAICTPDAGTPITTTQVPAIPFSVQLRLRGKRIKKTQYGQLNRDAA